MRCQARRVLRPSDPRGWTEIGRVLRVTRGVVSYITGSNLDFMARLRTLPVTGGDLNAFLFEGRVYTGALPSQKTQWNHVYAKEWAQCVPSGATQYYVSGAFQ